MFVHGDKMYVLSISSQYSGGNVEAVNVAAPSAIVPVSFEYMSQRIKPMGISLNGDKIIITEDGIVYSCSVDGGSAEKLGGSNIVKVAGCGSHIYYLTVGCASGNCAITSNIFGSMIFPAIMGFWAGVISKGGCCCSGGSCDIDRDR